VGNLPHLENSSHLHIVIIELMLTLTLTSTLALILTLILTLLLALTLTLNLTLSLILTLTRTAVRGNNFPVRRIFHYTGTSTLYSHLSGVFMWLEFDYTSKKE